MQNFDTYKERESRANRNDVVNDEGTLLAYPDLELRRNPPNVEVDNKTHPTETIITIDSADRAGTLIEVVQCLTELNLMVRGAQISSDGGWFVDVFNVEEASGGKVIDHKKLETIKRVLKIEYECERHLSQFSPHDERMCTHTVLELADCDRVGLLYDTAKIVDLAGLDVKSLAAWTQYNRGAVVIAALTEEGPLKCKERIELLRKDLLKLFGANAQVNIKNVKGYIHHERRLHRLLLQEAMRIGASFYTLPPETDATTCPSQDSDDCRPEVTITYWPRFKKYWRVTIHCQDRAKLFFDTVCTLADLDYEVYHATVFSHREDNTAFQDFYVRPRFGEAEFNKAKAKKLKDLLISSILRRAPHGLKVHVLTMDQPGLLCRVTNIFKSGHIRVTRATVKCLTDDKGLPIKQAVHTFFLESEAGDVAQPEDVVKLMTKCGGTLTTHLTEDRVPMKLDSLQDRFAFNVSDRPIRYGIQGSINLADSA